MFLLNHYFFESRNVRSLQEPDLQNLCIVTKNELQLEGRYFLWLKAGDPSMFIFSKASKDRIDVDDKELMNVVPGGRLIRFGT